VSKIDHQSAFDHGKSTFFHSLEDNAPCRISQFRDQQLTALTTKLTILKKQTKINKPYHKNTGYATTAHKNTQLKQHWTVTTARACVCACVHITSMVHNTADSICVSDRPVDSDGVYRIRGHTLQRRKEASTHNSAVTHAGRHWFLCLVTLEL